MYLNVYVPGLQYEHGIFRYHRSQPLPSAALMSPMTRNFVAALKDFAARHEIPLVQFEKGQRKDTVMAEHLRRFASEEGVVFIGKAQENTPVFRTERRRGYDTASISDRISHARRFIVDRLLLTHFTLTAALMGLLTFGVTTIGTLTPPACLHAHRFCLLLFTPLQSHVGRVSSSIHRVPGGTDRSGPDLLRRCERSFIATPARRANQRIRASIRSSSDVWTGSWQYHADQLPRPRFAHSWRSAFCSFIVLNLQRRAMDSARCLLCTQCRV